VASSGYVDWHRLDQSLPWTRHADKLHTYVYAFWLVDYGHNQYDRGLALFKREGAHPDWFIHADSADELIGAFIRPNMVISPNFTQVFENNLTSRPLLAAALLATNNAVYRREGQMWWAHRSDLTRMGRRLLKQMDRLYERPAVLVTFIDHATDEDGGPRGSA
jgi:hypothetical protein